MMFSFGDFDCVNNQDTAKEIENFLRTYWIPLLKNNANELNETFIAKIYNPEIEAYKRLKNIMKEFDDFQNKEVEYDISFIPKDDLGENLFVKKTSNNIENLDDLIQEDEDSNSSNIEHEEDKCQEINEAIHEERNSFYSNLAESMDEIQYELFSKCRTQNFLSKGKEAFIEWVGVKWSKNFVEFIAHLAFNEVRSIIELAIRDLDENHKLHKISNTLSLTQIKDSIEQRKHDIDKLISKVNFLKGMKLFIKEYVNYFKFKEHYQKEWKDFITVTKNKKSRKVILNFK